jgi:DNA polymerase-3 subunit alpha
MAALCGTMIDDIDRCAFYLNEARSMGLNVYGPDINKSGVRFTVEDDGLRIGLAALRNIGADAAGRIVEERQNGPFSSLMDLTRRVEPNAREFGSLTLAGALATFGTRLGISTVYPEVLKAFRKQKKKQQEGQDSLFSEEEMDRFDSFTVPSAEFSSAEILESEYGVMGLYVSGHPLDDYADDATDWRVAELEQLSHNDKAKILVLVSDCKIKRTKNGAKMAILTVQDQTGSCEFVMFPKTYAQYSDIAAGNIARIYVRAGNDFAGEKNYVFDSMKLMDSIQTGSSLADFRVFLPTGFAQDDKLILKLKRIFAAHYGWTPVSLYLSRSTKLKLPRNFTVSIDDELLSEIRDLFKEFASR